MPTKRKTKKNWPKYVYENNGTVIYRPRIPKHQRDKINTTAGGFLSPPVVLGKVSDPDPAIYRRYITAAEEIANIGEKDKGTVNWLVEKYLVSRKFASLKAGTQQDYINKLNVFLNFETKIKGANGKPIQVKQWPLEIITQPKLRRLIDNMLDDYQHRGLDGKSTVNGQFRVFSAVIKYGLQHFESIGLPNNPCHGIELFKENVRTRYVTHDEFAQQWAFAGEYGADYLLPVFELAYLLAGRSVEVCDLKKEWATEDGLKVERRKGSKTNIIRWTERLRCAYDYAIDLQKERGGTQSPYLITTRTGDRLTTSALKSAMARLKKKMFEAGYGEVFWTMHDLKHKGITDAKNKKIGGHKTLQMQQRYNHQVDIIEPPAY